MVYIFARCWKSVCRWEHNAASVAPFLEIADLQNMSNARLLSEFGKPAIPLIFGRRPNSVQVRLVDEDLIDTSSSKVNVRPWSRGLLVS